MREENSERFGEALAASIMVGLTATIVPIFVLREEIADYATIYAYGMTLIPAVTILYKWLLNESLPKIAKFLEPGILGALYGLEVVYVLFAHQVLMLWVQNPENSVWEPLFVSVTVGLAMLEYSRRNIRALLHS